MIICSASFVLALPEPVMGESVKSGLSSGSSELNSQNQPLLAQKKLPGFSAVKKFFRKGGPAGADSQESQDSGSQVTEPWESRQILGYESLRPSNTVNHADFPPDNDEEYHPKLRDDPVWLAVDGPVYRVDDLVAHWMMFRRTQSPPGKKGKVFTSNATLDYYSLPNPNVFKMTSGALGGEKHWGELKGPIYSKDKNSVHWFRIRQDSNVTETFVRLIESAVSAAKLLK